MRLPPPSPQYDVLNEANTRRLIETADNENQKSGSDYEVGKMGRLILTDTVTNDRYNVTIASGVLTLTML